MKQLTIASLVSLAFPAMVWAEPLITLDDDVVVTASRIPQERKTVIGDVSVIETADIERAGQSTLLELLQTQPGIEVMHNGGAGKTSALFMRGTNSNHIIVLVDGMRVNSETTGTTAFENIPTAQIERVEILRGPSTSLYGQDAIGGVIQIFTKKGKDGAPRFHASAGYGSYNTRTADAGISGSVGDTSFSLNASSYATDGFSAVRTHNRLYKDDDGYRNLSVSGSLIHQIVPGHSVGIQFFSSEGHNRYDNSSNATDFSNHNMARQFSYSIFSRNQITENWHSTIRIGEGRDDSTDYAETSMWSPVSRSYFDTKQRQLSWQNDITLPVGTLTLLYDRLEQRVSSSTQYDKTSRNNDGYAAIYSLTHGAHSAQLSYRSDHNSQYGTNDTGNIGYGYQINDAWQVTASYGSAFRAPTFNQLYYPGYSTPDLEPEKSDNVEASVRYHNQQTSLSATVYENRVRNLISSDPITWLPINVNRAKIQGLTLAGSQQWDAWTLRGNVDIQSPRSDDQDDNLLPLRANRHGSLNLAYQWNKLRIAGEMVGSSARYAELANTNRMGGYTLFNMVAEYQITPEWKLLGRANNIFDKKYALARDYSGEYYNTAGSNVFFSVSYSPQP
ncbi:vitamin B12 transporter [Methylobacillus rhizosphaerae]|uniref:Vitamin B12 transporter n=1 Tax=Methylobacillus rhizosphaerae TaxID=551994 RepID=A0A238XMW6_9PROT|nr:TonB-dependent receptor [Methylobacillus rhizosphaerae]SNR60277.1 vitamin B12 transporter [Methylobacillus rhizosphaerae]